MTNRSTWMVAGALLLLPAACAAPDAVISDDAGMQAWQDEAVADLEQMRDKFLSLGEAFPEDTWDWRPMEGVRSVNVAPCPHFDQRQGISPIASVIGPSPTY